MAPLPVSATLPLNVAEAKVVPLPPMTLIVPSFSKYWLPTLLVEAAPVTVQLVVVVLVAKLLVALTNI